MTIWRTRVACRIPKATNTHTEYVILIAFPLQQWLHERASLLRHSTLRVLLILHLLIPVCTQFHHPFLGRPLSRLPWGLLLISNSVFLYSDTSANE